VTTVRIVQKEGVIKMVAKKTTTKKPTEKKEGHYVGVVFADKLSNARTIARKMYGKDSNIDLELMRTDAEGTKSYRVIISK
jgi:hypothetical protein